MTVDRIPHDHPSLEHVRATVARHGGHRRRLEIPAGILPDESTIRVVLSESIRFGRISRQPGETADRITGVYDSAGAAKSGNPGTDRLQSWLDERDRHPGDSVHVDVITPNYAIGLRGPGESTVYPAIDPPTNSLDSIARSIEDEGH